MKDLMESVLKNELPKVIFIETGCKILSPVLYCAMDPKKEEALLYRSGYYGITPQLICSHNKKTIEDILKSTNNTSTPIITITEASAFIQKDKLEILEISTFDDWLAL